MTTYVLHSETLANRIGGAKIYEVTDGEMVTRVEGVATSQNPDRYIAKDGEVVAAGDEVKFISTAQLLLESSRAEPELPALGF